MSIEKSKSDQSVTSELQAELQALRDELILKNQELLDFKEKTKIEIASKDSLLNAVHESAPYIMMLVDSDVKVICLNKTGAQFADRTDAEAIGMLGGEVFRCLQSLNEAGCGGNTDCSVCPIRSRVNYTMRTGKPVFNGDGVMQLVVNGVPVSLDISVTTTLVQQVDGKAVLVSIENITERRKVEKSLRESEEKWRTIINTSPDAIVISSLDGILHFVSQQLVRIFGFETANELIGKNLFDYVETTYLAKANILLGEMMKGNYTGPGEYALIKKDGTLIFMEINAEILHNELGTPDRIFFVLRDISERRLAEEAIRVSNERLGRAELASLSGNWELHLDTMIMVGSEGAKKLYGMSGNTFNYSDVISIPLAEDRHVLDKALKLLIEKGIPYDIEFRIKTADTGELKVIHSVAQYDAEKNVLFGIIQDITLQKQIEQELRTRKQQFQNYFEASSIGLSVSLPDTTWIEVNHHLCNMLGYEKEELLGHSWTEFTHPDDVALNLFHFQEVLDGKIDKYDLEKKFIRKNGSTMYAVLSVVCQRKSDGTIENFLSSYSDITERKQIEETLKRSEERYRNIFENVQDVYFETDLEGFVLEVSPSIETLSKGQYFRNEVIGKPVTVFYAYEPQRNELLDVLRQKGSVNDFEITMQNKDSALIYCAISAKIVIDKSGKPIKIIGSLHDISQRKQDEITLRESEEKFKYLAESIQFGILIYQNSKWVYSNPAGEQISGFSSRELELMNFWELVHPDDLEMVKAKGMLRQAGNEVEDAYEFRVIDRYGTLKWVFLTGTSILYKGRPAGLISIADITESKKAQEALRASEEKFKAIANYAASWEGWFNPEGKLIWMNGFAYQLTGYTPEEYMASDNILDMIIAPEDVELARIKFEEALKGSSGDNLELRIPRKDGSIFWASVSWRPILDAKGNSLGFRTSTRDITERKNALSALYESEEKYRSIIEKSTDGIVIIDQQGTIIEWNQSEEAITGYSKQDFLGKPVWDAHYQVLLPEKRTPQALEMLKMSVKQLMTTTVADYSGKPLEYLIQRRDGTRRFIETSVYPIQTGSSYLVASLTRDITKRKQAEDEIRKLNEELEQRVTERTSQLEAAFRDLETFSYTASHDLRTPLRALNGFASILLDDYAHSLDAEGKRLLNIIIDSANKMGILIDDLLSFSRLGRQEIQLHQVNMYALAESVYNELVSAEDMKTITFVLHQLPIAYGDPSMIRQLWINLISNAIKFTSQSLHRTIEIGTITEKEETVYFIKDNGAGFDNLNSTQLFGVFKRLHTSKDFEGTGIGLAFVKQIIVRHHGKVWADAKVGQGATFYFTLPGSR